MSLSLTVLVVLGLRAVVVEPVRVNGDSMLPTLRPGQVVVVNKLDRSPERGDLITFRSPKSGDRRVKRVIGLGGDVVEIRDGSLFVNDVQVQEPYINPASVDGLYYGPITVSAESVLVLGDARSNSIDSRSHGGLPLRNVTGTVLARLWPPGPIPSSP